MMTVFEIEQTLIELFVQKKKQTRFIERLGSSKQRPKIWADLRDTRYLDPHCLTAIANSDKQCVEIVKRLESIGMSQKVYLMSSDEDIDGKSMALKEIISTIWQIEEVIGFCQSSKLGFFKNHEDEFYILQRK